MKKLVSESLNEYMDEENQDFQTYYELDDKEKEAVEFLRIGLESLSDDLDAPLPRAIDDYLEAATNRLVPQRMARIGYEDEFNYDVLNSAGEGIFDNPVTYAMAYSDFLDAMD